MANIKSQKKRILTNEKSRVRNLATRTRLKTYARKVREAVASGDAAAAQAALRDACKAYDKAATAGVIHTNNAANHKAKLTKLVNGLAA